MGKLKDDYTRNEILELAREFKRRRNFLGLSQLKLAKAANLSQSIINKFESGKIDPVYSTIVKIEKALQQLESITHLKAKDIMITEIISVPPETKISGAIDIMRQNDFSQLLVTKGGHLKGTIYEFTIFNTIANKIDIYNTSIEQFIEPSPIIVPPQYGASELNYIFMNKKTKFILVGQDNKILGIITKSDLFRH